MKIMSNTSILLAIYLHTNWKLMLHYKSL
jgi:hypothetical protein